MAGHSDDPLDSDYLNSAATGNDDAVAEGRELSLDELGQAYAELLQDGEDPYQGQDDEPPSEVDALEEAENCVLAPRSILEAMLFVGHPENIPLTSRDVAGLMRGVRPSEIDDMVAELRDLYDKDDHVYQVVSNGNGYQLALRQEWNGLQRRFEGRVREARLSQAAVDILAIVAYHQGIERKAIDQLRERNSSSILNQLVRRQLLRVERPAPRSRTVHYFTTDRFLRLFQLDSLKDLPQVSD